LNGTEQKKENEEKKITKHNIDWNIKLLLTSRRFSGRGCCCFWLLMMMMMIFS
jgi:hypothetical protein